MAFKIIAAFSLVAAAFAGYVPAPQEYHAAPQPIHVAQPVYTKAVVSYDSHPKYHFEYSVNDEHSGDVKNQVESRDGDLVQGEYSLIDSDGYKRVVQYTADHEHGFNAVVHREYLGPAVKATVAAPVNYAATQALVKPAHVTYASAPAVHHYATRAIVKSTPIAYAAAPAYPYHH